MTFPASPAAPPDLLVGTAGGLRLPGGTADLDSRAVNSIAVGPSGWWAVADGALHRRTGDGWEAVPGDDGRLTCVAATASGALAGGEGGRLLRVTDGAVDHVASFDRAPGRDTWYTPWGGPPAVRSIAVDGDGTCYVNVHVGGILRSDDGGDSWEPTVDVDIDVHEVRVAAGRVLAATGAAALAESGDGGRAWTRDARGLHATYCRAVAAGGGTVLLTASNGPGGGRAAVYRRPDPDSPFERCPAGPDAGWFEGNIDTGCLDASGDVAAFGTRGGEVYVSQDAGRSWQLLAGGLPRVLCVRFVS